MTPRTVTLTTTPRIAENPRSPRMEPHGKATRVRHLVLGLTVAAYMITYMDRVVISTAVPVIQKEFGFSLITMSYIIASFRWGYALFQIPGGWLGDRFGLECRLHDRHPLPVRDRRGRGVPHRHALAFTLDAAGRARIRPGDYACRLAAGSGDDAFTGRAGDCQVWVAVRLRDVRDAGRDLV